MNTLAAQAAAVATGGALGALMRYGLSSALHGWLGRDFPFGTLAVNVLGSLAIGYLLVALPSAEHQTPLLRLLLVTGVLGGFTTYSAFSLETLQLAQDGRLFHASVNVVATVAACLAATWGGVLLARWAHGVH